MTFWSRPQKRATEMRPLALHLEGFGAFADRTDLDFADVELFALTGPTGSGKTTVLDGICFALYGSVPRYGRGVVAPLITQGQMEATVVLEFSLGDSSYRVARRVRRNATGRGASTGEAVLEREGQSLAVGADQVTEAVEGLLGLNFDQFTTCVLLPQGEFARFLHERPAARQELLTALLDLGIYERISNLAVGRQRREEGILAQIEAQLARLGELTSLELETAAGRIKELTDLLTLVEERQPQIEALQIAAQRATELRVRAEQNRSQLASLNPPEGWEEGTEGLQRFRAVVEELEVEERELQRALLSAEEAMATLPTRHQMGTWLESRRQHIEALKSVEKAIAELPQLDEANQQATDSQKESAAELERLIDLDRAAHLRRNLSVGDPCPVCGEPLAKVAKAGAVGKEITKLEKQHEKHRATAEKAAARLASAQSQAARLQDRLDQLGAALRDAPEDLPQIESLLDQAEARVSDARKAGQELGKRLDQARVVRKAAEVRSQTLNQLLGEIVDSLKDHALPTIDRHDPVEGWRQLLSWRGSQLLQLTKEQAARETEAVSSEQAHTRALSMLRETLVEAGVAGVGHERDRVVEALAMARTRHQQIAEALESTARLTIEREQSERGRELNRQLALHLRTDKFRQWLFDEVFAALVAGANSFLADLTQGRYELAMSGREFEVIDHYAADHRRSAKSLSGGETFLVSLALAIALAEEVATTAGAHGLESLFLDEGFGTLDAESLDIVSGVIAELGAAGKTVGIVTHVTELAEQMPVRYQVARTGRGARVTVASG